MRFLSSLIIGPAFLLASSVPAFSQGASVTVQGETDAVCDFLGGLGLSGGGLCAEEGVGAGTLPETDQGVHDYQLPAEPTLPEPNFPAVIKEKIVIREVPVPSPPTPEPPEPAPEPQVQVIIEQVPVQPDFTAERLQQAYLDRRAGNSGLSTIAVPDWSNLAERPSGTSADSLPGLAGPALGSGQAATVPRNQVPELAGMPEGKYMQTIKQSSFPVDNSRLLTNDRFITGILETGINSQLGATSLDGDQGVSGGIIIQVSRDVFGYHGRNILIPKGSRLVCSYLAPDSLGVSRIGIICNRLLLAGNRAEIYDLENIGTDVQGRDGVSGQVDNRFFEKYGTAFVLAGISGAVRLSSVPLAGDDDDGTSEILDSGSEELAEKLGEITASILEETVNLNPIITIPQGTRITIRPRHDLYFKPVD